MKTPINLHLLRSCYIIYDMRRMLRVKKYVFAPAMLATLLMVVSVPAHAAEDCNGTATFFKWNCSGGDNQIMGVLGQILNWLAIGVSVAVLIGIVYGAVMYASAGGNEAQTKKAISIIRNAIIALILYFAMWAILQYLIPGGVFG